MRPLAVVVILGACATGVTDPDGSSGPGQPARATTPPPIPTDLTIFERLRDDAGPVPGLPAFMMVHRVDPSFCGGIAVVAKQVGPTDEPIADVFAMRFPAGLEFTPEKRVVKEASLNRFNAFVSDMTKRGAAARSTYSAIIDAKSSTRHERVAAAARVVQLQRYAATMLVRAEIPIDVRSGEFAGEKAGAFCDKLEEVAEPVLIRAEGEAKVCQELANGLAPGWWTAVCSLTPPVVTASAAPSTSR